MVKTCILVVDDEPSIRKFLRANLEDKGYKVLTAADGAEALQTIEMELPDLVIPDIMMPGLDGFQVLDLIRQHSNVPMLMLTAKPGSCGV